MKFRRRNIYSTRPGQRFRWSAPWVDKNFFCFHRFPHRLCTSYAPYCTGYPHPPTHTGFAAGPLGASVAGYLFFGARTAHKEHSAGLEKTAHPAGSAIGCGKPVDSGDNSLLALNAAAGGQDCQTPPVDLDRWRSAALPRNALAGWLVTGHPGSRYTMEDGSFVYSASGPGRGHPRIGREPEASPGYSRRAVGSGRHDAVQGRHRRRR